MELKTETYEQYRARLVTKYGTLRDYYEVTDFTSIDMDNSMVILLENYCEAANEFIGHSKDRLNDIGPPSSIFFDAFDLITAQVAIVEEAYYSGYEELADWLAEINTPALFASVNITRN